MLQFKPGEWARGIGGVGGTECRCAAAGACAGLAGAGIGSVGQMLAAGEQGPRGDRKKAWNPLTFFERRIKGRG